MKRELKAVLVVAALGATPVMAHLGPEAVDHHIAEHLLIALAIGLPLLFGLMRLLKHSGYLRR